MDRWRPVGRSVCRWPLIRKAANKITILSSEASDHSLQSAEELKRYLELKAARQQRPQSDCSRPEVPPTSGTRASGAGRPMLVLILMIMGAYHDSYERETTLWRQQPGSLYANATIARCVMVITEKVANEL